jgi:hypothetical protein
MTENDKLSGCNSYRVCQNCGHLQYFMNRPREEPNSLEENYKHDLHEENRRENEIKSKPMFCEKCGAVIPLC